MPLLVQPEELQAHLQRPVTLETCLSAVRVTEGWLRAATRLADWPDPIPGDLWSWAVELAGIVVDYPYLLNSRTVGAEAETGVMQRRAEILKDAAFRYGASSTVGPVGCFPDPCPWPAG